MPDSPRSDVSLRRATLGDADRLLAWRNDPEIRAASRGTERIDPAEHGAWLRRVLADPRGKLLIVEDRGEPVGQVRLDHGDGRWTVSVGLTAAARGRGLGRAAIAAAVAWLGACEGDVTVEAFIRPGNARSVAAFAAAGFTEVEGLDADGLVRYVFERRSEACADGLPG
jgi:RimJ/RimL family protein N-acetyltransferase